MQANHYCTTARADAGAQSESKNMLCFREKSASGNSLILIKTGFILLRRWRVKLLAVTLLKGQFIGKS